MESREKKPTAQAQCEEFRARHAEYVDGLLTTLAAARLASHVDACATCARYDRVIRKGAALVRDMPAIEPSDDFQMRLQHRLFHVQDERVLASPRPTAGAAAALGVAAMIALLAWSPVLFVASETSTASTADAANAGIAPARVAAGPVPANEAQPQPRPATSEASSDALAADVSNASARIVAPGAPAESLPSYIGAASAWYPATSSAQRATLVSFPGPHSPLIVTPPAHRSVRPVSAEWR